MIIKTLSWLLLLTPALGLDLTTFRFPPGINVHKIKNLMKTVDPKSCGCARPDQHCEVPVPEARYVGFTCKVGVFCCRHKRRPRPVAPIRRISENLTQTSLTPLPSLPSLPPTVTTARAESSTAPPPRVTTSQTEEKKSYFDPLK